MSTRSALCCWTLLVSLLVLASRQAVVEGFVGSLVGSFGPRQLVQRADNLQHGTSSSSPARARSVQQQQMFFGGSSGSMPKLYDGWFKKTQQIQKDIVAGAKSALRCGGTRGRNMIPIDDNSNNQHETEVFADCSTSESRFVPFQLSKLLVTLLHSMRTACLPTLVRVLCRSVSVRNKAQQQLKPLQRLQNKTSIYQVEKVASIGSCRRTGRK